MGQLSPKDKELVALGAALGSNCIPCVIYHLGVAEKIGMADEEIREAIEVADEVRKVPAAKVLETAYAQIGKAPVESSECPESRAPCCGC